MPNFQFPVISKLPDLQPSIFTTIGKLALEANALNLAQGFPNFEPDAKLLSLTTKAMQGNYNQYAPMSGIFSLRKRISEKINSLYQSQYNPETEVIITSGATQAIYTAITAMVNKNDEVIVFKPAYDCYEPAIRASGGIPVFVKLHGKSYQRDWEEVAQKITDKTKMIIINTPHNPSGVIFSKADMLQLQQLLKGTNIVVISDEVYEHIVFDNALHESVAKYKDLASRSFICASFGKTFHTTGWKMGYCVGPEVLMKEFRKIHEFNVFCVHHPAQKALATYLEDEHHYLELSAFYQEKRDFFLAQIQGSRFSFTPAEGTYFQLLDFSQITTEKDTDFAVRLIDEYNIASIPVSVFHENEEDKKQLRFCFAKTDDTLKKAAEVLHKL